MKHWIRISVLFAALFPAMQWLSVPASAADTFRAGDELIVSNRGAPLMLGKNTLATLPQGQRLRVVRTQGEWLGTSAVVDGQTLAGWVYRGRVTPTTQSAQRRTGRRTYSYQPAPSSGSYSRRGYSGSTPRGYMGPAPYGPQYWRADRKINGF